MNGKYSVTEIGEASFRRDTEESFLILGGGVAGLCAAVAIRERNRTGLITLIGEESLPPYSRPMLTKTGLRGSDIRDQIIHGREWYERHRITLRTGQRVTSLDTGNKTVTIADGEVLCYDKCVFALGAESYLPHLPGVEKEGVVPLRRVSDMEVIHRIMPSTRQATIIGGGVVGLESAWELKKAGLDVTVIERADRLMERMLDKETAERLEAAVRRAGIRVVTGARAVGIEGTARAEAVVLEDGSRYHSGLVVFAAGIKPNIEIAGEAGVRTGRGVTVDAGMRTGVPVLYACGDCAELEGVIAGMWSDSMEQGRVAGAGAAGDHLEYRPTIPEFLLHAAGVSLFAVGDPGLRSDLRYTVRTIHPPPGSAGCLVNLRTGGEWLERYYFADGILTGAVLMGDLTRMRPVADAVTERRSLEELGLNGEGVG